ncbi:MULTISPECIES: DUF3060 domain-containing protein [unclassified Duganella]|jgi:hypothetical protein|uniref:DUF3060 domain-containing protein n=1 Tax=unclassified Duganella TaxID=2636909 RepID=UPI00087E2EB8|nr:MULTISPECIES: DUF3060 domain-containing protein [unclassified Duganella]SDG70648.1 Protein of unknown function [Duganella sp. OV458]SDJ96189.1 Protein of unknown function [Duganella sp. OV510]
MLALRTIALAGILGLAAHGAMADDAVGEVIVDKDQIAIAGNGYVRTFPCDGRRVSINGTQHNITLTGTCASLEMNGAENKVTLALAPKAVMVVAGIQQTVNWRSTGEPQQRISGVGHKIQRN